MENFKSIHLKFMYLKFTYQTGSNLSQNGDDDVVVYTDIPVMGPDLMAMVQTSLQLSKRFAFVAGFWFPKTISCTMPPIREHNKRTILEASKDNFSSLTNAMLNRLQSKPIHFIYFLTENYTWALYWLA